MNTPVNIAVCASGGGSNFQALIDKKNEGLLHATLALLIGNNSQAGAFDRARKHAIPAVHLAPSRFPDESSYTQKLRQTLAAHRIDLIVLAGYMKQLPAAVIREYHNRIVNIHPGLLPAFGGKGMYGRHVHEAVIDYGAKVSGITIHFVDEEYDHGPVIFQETIKVLDTDDADSLAGRILTMEHAYYWQAIEAIAQKKITVKGRRVFGSL
jgi:phosphoribosylglycinamide formyltransferase-1